MKTVFSLIAVTAAFLCSAGAVYEPENITLDGTVRPFSAGKELLSLRMDRNGLASFEKKMFLKNVSFSTETIHGKEVITVRRLASAKKDDTAWHLRTKKIPIPAGGKKIGLITSTCVRSNRKHLTGGEEWSNNLLWYDKAGKILRYTPFRYPVDEGGFTLIQNLVPIPAGAASFQVQFGSDDPNLKPGEFIAYEFLKVFLTGAKEQSAETASFVTRAFPVTEGKIVFEGIFPKGTDISCRIATAPDQDGIPGKWSAFSGKQYRSGDVLPRFASPVKWIRLQVLLKGGKAVPVLKKLSVGPHTDENWLNFGDSRPPTVTNETPVSEDLRKPLRVRIKDENEIRWNTMSFTVDGNDVTKEVVRKGNTLTWQTKIPFEKKHHVFQVTVSDILGNVNHATRHFDFVPMPKKGVVTLRDDSMVLVDGKPFFPIGIYGVRKHAVNGQSYDNAFQSLKEGGFTLGQTYRQPHDKEFYEEYLPAAARHGIRLFVCNTGKKIRDYMLKNALNDKKHPGIVSWYIADDTVDHYTKEFIEERGDAIHSVAPAQLLSLCEGSRDYAGYSNASDIYFLTSYSVKEVNSENTCIGQVIYDMKEGREIIAREGGRNVAIWPTVQYFQGWGGWKRFPTPAELRGMSYAAVIHGGKGIIWYTYAPGRDGTKNQGAASTPERWKILTDLAKEFHALLPVLEERDASLQPEFTILSGPETDDKGNVSLSGLGKNYQGKYYLLTVNSTDKTVKGTITVKGMKSGTVLFERVRKLTLKNGTFSDVFPPHGVHVYVLE